MILVIGSKFNDPREVMKKLKEHPLPSPPPKKISASDVFSHVIFFVIIFFYELLQ